MRSNTDGHLDQHDDEPRSMPLSFEESGESLTVAPQSARRRPGFGTMALAGAVALGAVALFSMRFFARHGTAAEATSDAGKLVETFLKERGSSGGSTALPADLLDMDAYSGLRVERSDLAKNPFVLEGEGPMLEPVPEGGRAVAERPATDRAAAQVEGWQAIVDASALELAVQSTLVASRPSASVATVNGKVMRVGETVVVPKTGFRFELVEVEAGAARFRASDASLGVERMVRVSAKPGS